MRAVPTFYSAPVFFPITTDDFNIDELDTLSFCNLFPFPTSQLDWIARIGDYADTESKVITGNPIRQAIPLCCDFDFAQIAKSLLDRVDSKVRRTQIDGQFSRQRRLSGSRKPSK
jgi:hypothetical protein